MRVLPLLISLLSLQAFAQSLPEQALERKLPVFGIKESFLGESAATMPFVDSLSLSSVGVDARLADYDNAIYPQDGRGINSVSVSANTFLHLDSAETVWGAARFVTGLTKDVRWCNSIDYHLIAPYVLGDDRGGDLSFRIYDFSGGYARHLGKRLTLGAEMSYRAEMAWRDVDPRVKTIVSDLNVSAALAYKVSQTRIAGIDASLRKYSQNCDLDFFNPMNEINTLPLMGLGTYNKRFAGNTNKNSGHSGLGFGASARWVSTDVLGLQLSAGFNIMRVNLMLRNFNNITLVYTDTYTTGASMAYGVRIGQSAMVTPSINGYYKYRLGTENIFGTAAGASYDRIGSRRPYKHTVSGLTLLLPSEMKVSACHLSLTPGLGYCHTDESLTSAARHMEFDSLWQSLSAGVTSLSQSNKWLWHISATYRHQGSLSHKSSLTDPVNALQASVVDTYTMLTADSNLIAADVSVDRLLGKIMAGASICCSRTMYSGHGANDNINISIKIIF